MATGFPSVSSRQENLRTREVLKTGNGRMKSSEERTKDKQLNECH